jgi:hypothetical protein
MSTVADWSGPASTIGGLFGIAGTKMYAEPASLAPWKLLVVKMSIKVFTDGGPYSFELDDPYLPAKQFTVVDSRR